MLVIAVLLAAAANPWWGYKPTGRWAKSTAELAAEMLSPDQAADVVSHEFAMPIVQGGEPGQLRFIGRPRRSDDDFCTRKSYFVSLSSRSVGAAAPVSVTHQIRTGACDGVFAHVNPGANVQEAKRVLRWLEWAQTSARSAGPLPFALQCRSETDEDKCAGGARAVLATLPLAKTTIITRSHRRPRDRWDVSITETEPGQLYWAVDIDAAPGRESIELDWRIPAPF